MCASEGGDSMKIDVENNSHDSENLSVSIYRELRMKLISGVLRPNETLSIRTLADEYGVSAMPVREALRQLATEGALVGSARRAYRVPNLTSNQAADLFFIRSILESAAAEIAANRVRKSDLAVLSRLSEEMSLAWKNGERIVFLVANFRFHARICELTRNPALQTMIADLYVRTGPWLAQAMTNMSDYDHGGEHAKIVDALRRRDASEAKRLIEDDTRWGVVYYGAHRKER